MISFKKILQLFSFCLGVGIVISQGNFYFNKEKEGSQKKLFTQIQLVSN